jgi:hypothetical protein
VHAYTNKTQIDKILGNTKVVDFLYEEEDEKMIKDDEKLE